MKRDAVFNRENGGWKHMVRCETEMNLRRERNTLVGKPLADIMNLRTGKLEFIVSS